MALALVKMDADAEQVSFSDFWLLFPKRVARMEAEKAWNRLNGVQRVDALIGLSLWRPVWLAEGRLGYVPHASTWLNQQRWTDELPTTWGTSSAGHVPAVLPTSPERSVMPDHVKALLAKMRGKP